jgi:peptide/nickel transport system permease protein
MLVIGVVLTAAPALSPHPPDRQEDPAGARYLPPLTRAHALDVGPRTWVVTMLRRTEGGWTGLRAGRPVTLPDAQVVEPPRPRLYVLGTDSLGRDLLSRLLHAARHSMIVTASVVLLALILGTCAGMTAGWLGGWWDALLMRAVDGLLCLPRLVVYLACAAVLRPSTPMLIAVLAATTWTGLARILRTEVMALKGGEMTMAARAVGCSALRVAARHLLPAMTPLLAVIASLRVADTILLESAVSFLGLGAPPPAVSLGGIIASARDGFPDSSWAVLWPGLVIIFLVTGVRRAAAGPLVGREGSSVA